MARTILTYGIISGLIVIVWAIFGFNLSFGGGLSFLSVWMGYLTMLLVLSSIFVAVKRYRDEHQGGVITFGTGLLLGLGIAATAGVVYVAVWEIYLFATEYVFIDHYTQSIIDSRRAAGASDADTGALVAEMEKMKAQYGNPLYRLPMTFLEIFPVGLIISVISAAILRRSEILSANS